MAITLKVPELKRFFANTGTIKSTGIVPVLDYVLIDKNRIIKTNLNAYVVMGIEPVKESILIDERILTAMVKATSSDSITVEKKEKKVFLSDGVNKMFFALADIKDFPKFPDSDKEGEVVLDAPILKAIGIASKNLANKNLIAGFNFVNVAHGYIFGSDQYKFYLRKVSNLPTILIDPICANIISQFGAVKYYQVGNYDFYEVGSFLFGFAQQEATAINFVPYLNVIAKEPYMEIGVDAVLNFLDLLTASTASLTTTIDFSGNKLSFYDTDIEVGNDVELEVDGDFRPTMSFLPRLVNSLLRSIDKKKIRMSPLLEGRSGVCIWDAEDEDFIGMLAEVKKDN